MALYELAKNPNIQQRLRDEVTTGLGREPVYDDFANPAILPYLDAVIKETYVPRKVLHVHPSLLHLKFARPPSCSVRGP